jgi:hypothetical protein
MEPGSNSDEHVSARPLSHYRGIAKEVFQELGGAEAFIRAERERFYDSGDDPATIDPESS